MDQGWKGLPLLVNFLLLSNAYGFRDGASSNSHHHWGQPSDNTFSPRAVQSSVSEVPVSGNLPEEVGSSLFANRPLKSLNLFQFVKGRVSSRPESTSHAQTAPSRSVLASLPLLLNEQHAGSLTSLQGTSGSTITDTASVPTQGDSTSFPPVLGTSGLSTSNQSPPSFYMSSSQETKSAQATLPVFSQESISNSSSSAPGANYTSQGSPVPLSEGSDQSIAPQGQSSYSSLSQSQGGSSPYSPDSYNKLSSSVSSQSTSDQSTPSLYSSSSQGSSGSLLGASGSSFQVDLSPQSQEISNQLLPSPLEVSSHSTNSQSSPSLFMVGSKSSSDSQSTGPASPLDTQGSLSHSFESTQTQGSASTSQGSSAPELSGNSYSQPTSSSGARFGASTSFASQEMSSTSSGSVQPQGTTSQFAPGSSSSYPSVSLSSPQGVASQSATVQSSRKQFTSGYGTQSGSSTLFSHGGSLQPQAIASQFAPGSPSSYPSVSLSSPQGFASQPSQAFQSYAVAQNQKSQRWPPSEGIQTSGAAVSQGSSVSQSSPMQSRFSSLSLGGSSSGDPGEFASTQGGNTSYSSFSLHSQSPSSKYTSGSHAYAKLGSSPLAVSSQSTSDQSSNGRYSSESRRTQSLLGVVERPSRLSLLAPFDSPSSNQISERLVTLRRFTGSNLAQSLGLSAQASSVGMFSGIPQTAQALRESGSDVQLYNEVGSNSRPKASTSSQKFSSFGAQSFLKPSELLRYEPSIEGQGASSVFELLSSYGSTYNQNAPASKPSHSFSSSRYYSKG